MATRAFVLKNSLSRRLRLSQQQFSKEAKCYRQADLSHNVALDVS
jgi:hypothetical protein